MGRPPGRTLLFVAAAVDLAAAAVVVVHSCMVRQMQMGHHLHYSHRVFHVLSTNQIFDERWKCMFSLSKSVTTKE